MKPTGTPTIALSLVLRFVYSSPVPSESLDRINPKTRSLPLAPHVLPLKGVPSRRRRGRNQPRTVPLIDPDYERDFLVQVSLGGQTVDLEVDTGSSNTWAVSEGYTCKSGYACDYSTAIEINDAFEIIEGESFTTDYVDGSGGTGILVNTSVTVDGITVPAQTIGLVNSLGSPGDGLMSGFIGMAYPSITSAYDGSTPITYSSILNTMFTEGLVDPLFSMAISRDASQSGFGGYLTIGGIPDISDPYINAASIFGSAAIELNPEDELTDQFSNYAIDVDAVSWSGSSGTNTATNSTSFLYIVDSGTTLSHFPNDIAAAVNALFQPPATLGSNGLYSVSCSAIAPLISVTVGGVTLPINPVDLKWSGGTDGCASGVQGLLPSYPIGILGDSAMRSLLAVFDWGEKMVHLASRPDYES